MRNKSSFMSLSNTQIGVELQLMATFGCFVWLAAGLQGGVVFGGKFFFPTLALLSLAFQVTRCQCYITFFFAIVATAK
jgi:hypothetical protein